MEQNLSGLSLILWPCAREGPLRTEGVGRALLPSLTLRPSALEMELRLHTEVPFVCCSQRTGKPGGRGWHCLGRVALISAGLREWGFLWAAGAGDRPLVGVGAHWPGLLPHAPRNQTILVTQNLASVLPRVLSFSSCLWSLVQASLGQGVGVSGDQ